MVYWELLTCVACIYVAITVPYIAGIDEVKGEFSLFGECVILQIAKVPQGSWQGYIAILDLMCDFLFVVDLVLNFHTARWAISNEGREHWRLIEDLPTIRKMYLWSMNSEGNYLWLPGAFCIDLFGVIPWQYVDCFGANASFKYLRLLRLIKLTRMYRLRRLIQGLHYKFPTSVFIITCMELVMTMFLAAHWLCCIWYRVGYDKEGWVHSSNAGLMDEFGLPLGKHQEIYEWVTALYWAITTMTTIGYGDISATTQAERGVACIVMIMGCGFFAWSTGTITSVLTTKAACKVRFSDKLEELAEFMGARALSPELRAKIRCFYMLKFPTMKIFDEEGILEDLPGGLANQVRVELFRDVVQKCVLFQSMDAMTRNEICIRLISEYKTEGIQLTWQGEIPDALYIVRFGSVTVSVNATPIMDAHTGDMFGENALLGLTPDGRRNRSSFAKTMCEVCVLRKGDLNDLLKMEGFRRIVSTLVHTHISTLDAGVANRSHVSATSRYCVHWRTISSQIGTKWLLRKDAEDIEINRKSAIVSKESSMSPMSPSKIARKQSIGEKQELSVLRTQCTVMTSSLALSQENFEKVEILESRLYSNFRSKRD